MEDKVSDKFSNFSIDFDKKEYSNIDFKYFLAHIFEMVKPLSFAHFITFLKQDTFYNKLMSQFSNGVKHKDFFEYRKLLLFKSKQNNQNHVKLYIPENISFELVKAIHTSNKCLHPRYQKLLLIV